MASEERYGAALRREGADARALRGFFKLIVVTHSEADPDRDRFPAAAPELMRYMRDHTGIDARVEAAAMSPSNPAIFKAPVLYMTGSDGVFHLSEAARANLGQYLREGGFLFAEEIRHSAPGTGLEGAEAGLRGTPFDMQFKELTKDPLVLGNQGARWQKVPLDHPLYDCYYAFPAGPPMAGAAGGNVLALEMLEWRGRVVVVFSDLNISWYWGDPLAGGERERGLQFGVNLMVFALTQPGGLTRLATWEP